MFVCWDSQLRWHFSMFICFGKLNRIGISIGNFFPAATSCKTVVNQSPWPMMMMMMMIMTPSLLVYWLAPYSQPYSWQDCGRILILYTREQNVGLSKTYQMLPNPTHSLTRCNFGGWMLLTSARFSQIHIHLASGNPWVEWSGVESRRVQGRAMGKNRLMIGTAVGCESIRKFLDWKGAADAPKIHL